METREERRKWREERRDKFRAEINARCSGNSRNGHIWTGVFLLIIGVLALLNAANFPIPQWIFTWEMLLIGIGLFLGIRNNFRGGVWFILMLVGGIFLVNEIYPEILIREYLWPMAFIIVGLFFIFRPGRKVRNPGDQKNNTMDSTIAVADKDESASPDDIVDTTSIFGGIKKNILSKNFRGGDIVNIFGGSEIDMTQADINGTVRLEMTQIFGGTKLLVPSNWQVKTEMAAIFGGVEDKRSVRDTAQDPTKVLILVGTSIFAGIEIRSY